MRSLRVRLCLLLGVSLKVEVPATLLCVEVRFPKAKAAVPLLVGDGVRLGVLLVSDKGVGLQLVLWTFSRVRSHLKVGGMPRSLARVKACVSDGYWLSPVCSRTGVFSRALGSLAASSPLLSTTASRAHASRVTTMLLPLRALLLLLLPLRALLLLLAKGRVRTLALYRTELVGVGLATAMASLTLLPLQDDGLAHICK